MKHLRLVALVLAVSACCASLAFAAGAGKETKVSGSSDCCGAKTTATTAGATGACPATTSCPSGSAQCTAAQRAQCAKAAKTKGAASSCSTAGAGTTRGAASCSMHGASAAAARTCAMHATTAAGCKGDMAVAAHGECVLCTDQAACEEDVRALNAHAQVVALRNGAMIVYTAETPEGVRALQAALARHNELIMAALSANGNASLCGGCKSFRGAMASGKFSRELVNVKTGAQVLLTSNDREIVQRIHDMTVAAAARTRS